MRRDALVLTACSGAMSRDYTLCALHTSCESLQGSTTVHRGNLVQEVSIPAMSRDCTGVSSITTITGGNGRTCDLTRCGLNLPSGCHGGDGASGPTEGPGVVNLAQLLVSTSGALLTLDVS